MLLAKALAELHAVDSSTSEVCPRKRVLVLSRCTPRTFRRLEHEGKLAATLLIRARCCLIIYCRDAILSISQIQRAQQAAKN